MNTSKTRKACENTKNDGEGYKINRKRMRPNLNCKSYRDAKKTNSQDSIIYVGNLLPKKHESNVDLTKSDSDMLWHPKKQSKKNVKGGKIRRRHSLKELSDASVVTIQSVNKLASTSSENFGLVRSQHLLKNVNTIRSCCNIGDNGAIYRYKLNSSGSSIQLKRTHPFTSVTNFDCKINTYTDDKDMFLIDDIVERINIDLGNLEMCTGEIAVYSLDLNSFVELYRFDSTDNFDSLDI